MWPAPGARNISPVIHCFQVFMNTSLSC